MHLGNTYDSAGNKNLELCFVTDSFEKVIDDLKKHDIKYLHEIVEENWGQQTIRFYDPENNLIEIGETNACFVKRFYKQGMTMDEVAKRTSISVKLVNKYISEL